MIFKPYLKFPVVDHYINTKRLKYYADQILVTMKFENEVERHHIDILCDYNKEKYKKVLKDRWDPYENCPIEETGKLCYLLRRVSNDDESRYSKVKEIAKDNPRLIVFYNFTYELHKLRELFNELGYSIGEWNGEKHTEVPTDEKWVYLCQYIAASEGWNNTTTDTMVFFSQNYSYKVMEQSSGRIDRLNTPFKELYYYHLRSASPIDIAIKRALKLKQNFNERLFMRGYADQVNTRAS